MTITHEWLFVIAVLIIALGISAHHAVSNLLEYRERIGVLQGYIEASEAHTEELRRTIKDLKGE